MGETQARDSGYHGYFITADSHRILSFKSCDITWYNPYNYGYIAAWLKNCTPEVLFPPESECGIRTTTVKLTTATEADGYPHFYGTTSMKQPR